MRISFFFFFKLAVLLMFLHSMHLWVTWGIPDHYIGGVVSIVMVSYIVLTGVKLQVSFNRVIGAVLLMSASILGYTLNTLGSILGPQLTVLPCLLLLFISNPRILVDTFNFIVNFLAFLLPISYLVFLLSFLGLPRLCEITHFSGLYGTFDNYVLALQGDFYGYRFSSVFLEPGHLGMILSFLLFALKFNFKDIRVVIFLLASFFTFSLAAYVLVFVGYVSKLLLFRELSVRFVLQGSLLVFLLYLIASNFNEGDNLLNNHLFARLQPDEERGIAGNNRTYGKLDEVFEVALNNKELVLWGIGVDNYNLLRENFSFGGAGVKVYVLRHGFVSALMVFAAYYFMGVSLSKHTRFVFYFGFLLALSFWQRAYPFWTSWLVPFMAGVIQVDFKKKKCE